MSDDRPVWSDAGENVCDEPKADGWYWLKVDGLWRMYWRVRGRWRVGSYQFEPFYQWGDFCPADVVPVGPPLGDCRTEHLRGCTCGKGDAEIAGRPRLSAVEELLDKVEYILQFENGDVGYQEMTRVILPAVARALKVAMGVAVSHRPSSGAPLLCNECARPWPCSRAESVAEVEAILAEAMKLVS